ncbi:MAG TPA: ferrochelatase [Terriglobales bacterium]|nr:ferrochelatase [Terriglobales bacterium]
MSPQSKSAVLLLAHGSPDRVDEIPEFLRYVTGGRPLPEAVVKEVQHRYGLIGASPLKRITLKQGELLARELKLPVYVGMRNWRPLVGDVVAEMQRAGIARAVAICLAPQNSRTSVGLYREALLGDSGTAPFEVDFVDNWHDHPLLIKAFAEKLAAGWKRACDEAGSRVPIIFTAHSVPERTITEGDPYEAQAKETASLVAMEAPQLTLDDWQFAFQSQGMSGGAWLGPTVEDTIRGLKAKGHRAVFLQPIGFLCDHVEVLYDIDIAFREFAAKEGMRLWRAESLNESPTLIAALADVARSRLAPAGEKKQQIVQIASRQ